MVHFWFQLGVMCGLSLVLVLGFFSDFSGFPSSTKTNTPNSNSTRIEDSNERNVSNQEYSLEKRSDMCMSDGVDGILLQKYNTLDPHFS